MALTGDLDLHEAIVFGFDGIYNSIHCLYDINTLVAPTDEMAEEAANLIVKLSSQEEITNQHLRYPVRIHLALKNILNYRS